MESAESLSCLICVFSYLINYSDGLTYTIPEEQPRFTVIGNIAKDEDLRSLVSEDDYNSLEFHFLNLDNQYLTYFTIDSSSSDLIVDKPLDWEVICEFSTSSSCPVNLDVAAQSKTGQFFKKISITIFLEDINDHPPLFESPSFGFTLSESEVIGKSITLNTATDQDSLNFSVQSYDIIPAEVPFRADFTQNSEGPSELNLVLTDKLDREVTENYYFMLVAVDGGDPPLNGTMMINVTVEDDNDNRPVFEQSVYRVRVKENFPLNTTFLNVTATDLDIGRNARISYHINSQQAQDIKDTYAVNSSTGEVFLKKHLEYVSDKPVKVKIDAVDDGERPSTSHTIVEVTVEDSENNAPVIKINLLSSSQSAEATEYASFGSAVAYVEVIDKDGDRNGRVSCEVEGGPFGLQAVEDKEYKIIVFGDLDRETIDKHSVTIQCHDFGVPELTSSANFTVIVLDENDNAPIFTEEIYESTIMENNENGSTIIQVFARDADIGLNSQVSYYLDYESLENFTINNKSGLITANKEFDREDRARYEFIVYAIDSGSPPLSSSALVSVTIDDENDNQPKFKNLPYIYHIPESQMKETILGKIIAEDKDAGGNGYVSYSLVGNYSELPFEVLPDGTLKTLDSFDREKVARYNFEVLAIDNGIDIRKSNTANVTVHVTDINDNSPIIVYPPQNSDIVKLITYMMPPGTQVMKIEASDADEGKNAELTYKIFKRNDTKMFEMGRNGEIYVARKLYETEIDSYFLEIVVSDGGSPPKRAWTKVTINVLTKNVTAVKERDASIDKQNIIIAIIVVVVTVVIAAAILIIIWIVRRHDLQKRKFLGSRDIHHNGDNDSGFSSTGGRKSPDVVKSYENGMVPPAAILPPMTINRGEGKLKDVTFQDTVHVREKSADSTVDCNGESTVQLHRLASLRLHQALIQNHNKPWTSQSELNPDSGNGKKQEDLHSDLSADTATYDSGIGGSVSDTGDLRISQLQLLVKQNGRRGQPPHKPAKPPRVIARGHSQDKPPERPPPLKNNPYKSKSPVQSPVHFSPAVSPSLFATSSPTPCSPNQASFFSTPSPTNFIDRQSPSKNVVQDLLMYKKFQNGLRLPNGRLTVDESVDTTHMDDDGSTTSGSYYIDNTAEDWKNPPVSDIYV